MPLGGSEAAAATDTSAAIKPATAPEPINLDDLEQIGPLIKSLVKNGRADAYLGSLAAYIGTQEAEIERLCNYHYQEFIASVDQLLKVRSETLDLKRGLEGLAGQFTGAVKGSLDKKRDLVYRRKMLANLEATLDALTQCQAVVDLALRAKSLYESRKYYSALRCTDAIRARLHPIMLFDFAVHMNDALPSLQLAIRTAVHSDLRDWFVAVRENSRRVGTTAVTRAATRIESLCAADKAARARGNSGMGGSMVGSSWSVAGLVGDAETEGRFSLLDNEQSFVDFRPLYQAIHIDGVLGELPELVADFEEQRRLQANLFLTPKFALNSPTDIPSLVNYLHDVAGFFLIEATVLATTVSFRSRAAVDELWEQTIVHLGNLVTGAIGYLLDPGPYLQVEAELLPFAEVMLAAGFTVVRVIEMAGALFERYTDILKQTAGEQFHELVEMDDWTPMTAATAEEHDRLRRILRIPDLDSAATAAPATSPGGRPARRYPRPLAFSAVVPGVAEQLHAFVAAYYEYAHAGFAAHHTVGRADLDDVVRRAVDNLLVRYVHQPMVSAVEAASGARGLPVTLQAYLNFDMFVKVSGEVERELAEMRYFRTSLMTSSRTVLQATEGFAQARKMAEKRVFDLLNRKISEFLKQAEYDFMPTASSAAHANKMPSPYLRDLVNFLTTVAYSTLDHMPSDLKSFIYFEAFDHLAGGMMEMLLNPSVRRINMMFVDIFAADIEFLERFIVGLGNANVQDTFQVLRQAVNLLQTENPAEYLDPAIANKRYSRLKKPIVVTLLEKYVVSFFFLL
ncbi:exocyst complex subunit Sec15-like-domain-containing protein [Blastocladiella britannica]|nr:exocyst complex subunit Sec15-like-domain-containing protein [Blastocladiella britannica]